MAQLAVAAAGAAIGGLAGPGVLALGLTGAQIGWMAGSFIGNSLFGKDQKSYGPRLNDLTVMGSSYGSVIPIIYGTSKVSGQVIWASSKREKASTQTAGGKGQPAQEYTTYTYEVDLLILLADNVTAGISRLWYNDKVVWTNRNIDGYISNAESDLTKYWARMTFYNGNSSQLPDPTYEASVGSSNANAYRGRSCVFIQGLELGSSGNIPNIAVELYTNATLVPSKVAYALNFENYTEPLNFKDDSRNPKTLSLAGSYSRSATVFRQPSPGGSGCLYEPGSWNSFNSGLVIGYGGDGMSLGNKNFCLEFWIYPQGSPAGKTCFTQGTSYSSGRYGLVVSADLTTNNWMCWSGSNLSGYLNFGIVTGIKADPVRWYHICVTRNGNTFKMYINGNLEGTTTASGTMDMDVGYGHLLLGNPSYSNAGMSGYMDMVRLTVGETRYYSNFDPPEVTHIYDDGPSTVIINDVVTLSQVVDDLCKRSGLSATQYDLTALSGISKKIHCLNISQISTSRNILEVLLYSYGVEVVVSDKIYFKVKNTSTALTIPYKDIGFTNEEDPIIITKLNNLEIPAKGSLSYIDINNTYKTAVEYSDMMIGSQDSVMSLQAPLGMTRDEAKSIIDTELLKRHSEVLKTSITIPMTYSKLQVNDIIVITTESSRTYRMRIEKIVDYAYYLEVSLVSVDSTISTSISVYNDTQKLSTIPSSSTSKVFIIDSPILRDADDQVGFYYGAYTRSSNWSRSTLMTSLDNQIYYSESDIFSPSTVGYVKTVLNSWNEGDIIDNKNTFDVTIYTIGGQLSTVSREALLNDSTLNCALIGNEIVQYLNAELIGDNTYRISGLFRGRKGTSTSGHTDTDRFVKLDNTLRHKSFELSSIGSSYYVKAVSSNQKISDAYYTYTPVTTTAKLPIAPVDARANRDSTNTVISWKRRTRYSTSFNNFVVPLGESSEAYEVEIYTSNTFATLKRTLTGITSSSVVYTSAQQVTDFGSNQSTLYIRVYQISSTVGRGAYLQATI